MWILLEIPEIIKSKVAATKNGSPILKVRLSTIKGLIKLGIPITNKILKIFEPKTFPRAISCFFVKAALTETTNSGKEVPRATIVTPTIKGEILKANPIFSALLTNKSADFIKTSKLKIKIII